jgi:hypothetical protein
MATTSVLGIQFPSEYDDPFTAIHLAGMEEIDEWLRIIWEEANLIIVGGGTFQLAGDVFSWSDTIRIINGRTNKVITVAAGNVTIPDGEVASLTGVTRPMANQALSSWDVAAGGPVYDKAKLAVFRRVGSNVYTFNNVIGLERVTTDTF